MSFIKLLVLCRPEESRSRLWLEFLDDLEHKTELWHFFFLISVVEPESDATKSFFTWIALPHMEVFLDIYIHTWVNSVYIITHYS